MITAEQTSLPVSDPVRRDRVIHAAQAISTIDRQLVATDASHLHAPHRPTGGEVVNLRFGRAVGEDSRPFPWDVAINKFPVAPRAKNRNTIVTHRNPHLTRASI